MEAEVVSQASRESKQEQTSKPWNNRWGGGGSVWREEQWARGSTADLTDRASMGEVVEKRPSEQLDCAFKGVVGIQPYLNAFDPHLGPVQQTLAHLVACARACEHLLWWEDPYLTLLVCAACLISSLLLAALPLVISWHTCARLLGAVLLGPVGMIIGLKRRHRGTRISTPTPTPSRSISNPSYNLHPNPTRAKACNRSHNRTRTPT